MHYFFDGKMTPRRSAPKETGHVKTLSKYDKIAVEKRYGCIKNGKIVKKKRVIKKLKCKAPKWGTRKEGEKEKRKEKNWRKEEFKEQIKADENDYLDWLKSFKF